MIFLTGDFFHNDWLRINVILRHVQFLFVDPVYTIEFQLVTVLAVRHGDARYSERLVFDSPGVSVVHRVVIGVPIVV